jgi:hypothetical protein
MTSLFQCDPNKYPQCHDCYFAHFLLETGMTSLGTVALYVCKGFNSDHFNHVVLAEHLGCAHFLNREKHIERMMKENEKRNKILGGGSGSVIAASIAGEHSDTD